MSDIVFVTGEFQKFRVTGSAGLHLGQYEMNLPENAIIEFDGQTVRYAGKDYAAPAVQGAVRSNWVVPEADSVSQYVPKPAGVRVKEAQSTGDKREDVDVGSASEEERVVGDVANQKQKRDDASTAAMSRPLGSNDPANAPAPAAPAEDATAAPPAGPVTATEPPAPVKFPTVVDEGSEGVVVGQATKEAKEAAAAEAEAAPAAAASDEGVPVAGVKFSDPKTKVNLGDAEQVRAAKEAGQKPSENLGKAAPPERQASKEEIAAARAATGREAPASGAPPLQAPSTTIAEGEDIKATGEGGATGDVSEAKTGETLTELLPDAASTGVPDPTPAAPAAPAAPDITWDRSGHWQARVTKALKHADDAGTMTKILAAETPAVQKHIKAGLTKLGKPIPE